MVINNKAHLFIILMPAMAQAIGLPVYENFSLPFMIMLDQIRHDAPLNKVADDLWNGNTTLTKRQVMLLVRMTRTLWSIIKHVPNLKERLNA